MKFLIRCLIFWTFSVDKGQFLTQTFNSALLDMQSNCTNSAAENYSLKILSRKRRYLVFPAGSSFSVAVCMAIGVYGNPNYNMFSWAVNWGVAYNLPNETISIHRHIREPKAVTLRRHRRDLYRKMETAINSMGHNGRQCVLRALCESSQFFGNKGSNMAKEMLRSLFSFPKSRVLSMESDDTRVYDDAYRKGRRKAPCTLLYPFCRFSLIELALGKYTSPLGFM
ncbi:uncharacterized protein LOC129721711 [Wyeomyia smithii]|uniref:uncharacterized protein LOC129721711 n=1 Tax=Wyeomyia smithii TaxID=174621 RepID=UPI002467F32C|nr:uncharacterized protein LOC129721711 [Wyeomyia smithii]